MKEKNMKDMTIIELMEYWISEWTKDEPLFENDAVASNEWDTLMRKRARNASLKDLIEVLHRCDADDFDNPTIWDIKTELGQHLVGDLYEKVEQIEKSVQMLLKEHEHEPAKITVGQLNRLKGGI